MLRLADPLHRSTLPEADSQESETGTGESPMAEVPGLKSILYPLVLDHGRETPSGALKRGISKDWES
jgi:hypothetical protein